MGVHKHNVFKSRKQRKQEKEKRRLKNPYVKQMLHKKKAAWERSLDAQQTPHDNSLVQSKLLRVKERLRKEREAKKLQSAISEQQKKEIVLGMIDDEMVPKKMSKKKAKRAAKADE
eukprot:TRINITY_DN84285_c0_g1_i1.p1 TRINITY_DN84285_c0_g1~~TRINITY_DN84285_c0_g1_i1.p1  ORF type:complete len:116 (-),score=8.75 TRINITY_DN84285_c0_g1_i1:188-535(-)